MGCLPARASPRGTAGASGRPAAQPGSQAGCLTGSVYGGFVQSLLAAVCLNKERFRPKHRCAFETKTPMKRNQPLRVLAP